MFRFLFFLHQLILVPYNLVTAPFRASKTTFSESGRGRAMMLGLPAFIVAAAGLSVLSWAEWGNREYLEQKYNTLAEKVNEEKSRLINEMRTEEKLGTGQTNPDGSRTSVIAQDDPRRVKLDELQEAEEIYLEKLINLNPDEPDFRFRLAQVASLKNDKQRCFSLMKSIAPDDEPGFARAHIWMAETYLNQRTNSAALRRQNMRMALQHAEHCLVRESTNEYAKFLKARLLTMDRRYLEALKVYQELFASDPRFYKAILQLNEKLGQQSQNSIVLDQAQLRFKEAVDEATKNSYSENWSNAWTNLVVCLRDKSDYEYAVNLLVNEEKNQALLKERDGTPEAASRHIHIKQLLTMTYTDWANLLASQYSAKGTPELLEKQLELLENALALEPNNEKALQLISRISAGSSALAERARKTYNPEDHDDAPATVLNEMGSRSMQAEQYDKAIKYFELARRKSPNEPGILNNLAYTYLVCENKNPDRALQLVNQAIRQLTRISDPNKRKELASHFYDTRGRALMQMNRLDEAAAALEMAMQIRPENQNILTALIKCYEGRDDLQAEVYRKRLQELQLGTSEKSTTESESGK